MEFDWHPAKCAKNIAERGIDFADVLAAFVDPDRKLAEDTRKDYGEIRINMLARMLPLVGLSRGDDPGQVRRVPCR